MNVLDESQAPVRTDVTKVPSPLKIICVFLIEDEEFIILQEWVDAED